MIDNCDGYSIVESVSSPPKNRIAAFRKRDLTVSQLLTPNVLCLLLKNLCHLAHIAATAFQSSGFFSFRCCQKTTNTFFKLLKNVVSEQIFREKTLTPPHLEKATDLSNYPTLIGVYSAKQNIYSFLICIYEFLHPSAWVELILAK